MEQLRSEISKIDGPDYQVFALKYGEHGGYPSYLYHWLGDPPLTPDQSFVTVGYYYWLIKGPDKNILVDVGCTAETGQAHGMSVHEDHDVVLGRMGLAPQDIDSIIISHPDFDHFDGITVFEDGPAPVYMHEAAFSWLVSKARRYPLLRMFAVPSAEEVALALRMLDADRLRLIDCGHGRMVEIEPGLHVLRADGHHDGLLAVVVKTAQGLVVLASDTNYLYSNLEKRWPGGLIRTTLTDALDIYPILDLFTERGAIIVPGHDLAIMDKFPAVQPGVVRIA